MSRFQHVLYWRFSCWWLCCLTSKGSSFWRLIFLCKVCLTHKRDYDIWYRMIGDLIGLIWHMVYYIHYWWCVLEWVGHNRKTNEEHDKDCVEVRFQLLSAKLDKGGERGDKEDIGAECGSIIIWDWIKNWN